MRYQADGVTDAGFSPNGTANFNSLMGTAPTSDGSGAITGYQWRSKVAKKAGANKPAAAKKAEWSK